MAQIQKHTLGILEGASRSGRHDTALKAIRETRANVELISKLGGLLEERGNTFDLQRLTSEEIGLLLRTGIGELSTRQRQTLLLEDPELQAFFPGD
jgi:hypothetical protein